MERTRETREDNPYYMHIDGIITISEICSHCDEITGKNEIRYPLKLSFTSEDNVHSLISEYFEDAIDTYNLFIQGKDYDIDEENAR